MANTDNASSTSELLTDDAREQAAMEQAALAAQVLRPENGAASAGAHSHGTVPGDARPERLTSRDPADFPVPGGREEEWRFTPLKRMKVLLEPLTSDGKVVLEAQAAPGVTVSHVPGSDPLVGSVLTPADRVSALAMASVDQAVVVSVPSGSTSSTPTFLTVRGEGGTAYGHLVVDVAAGAQAVLVLDHVGTTTLAANTEFRIGDNASLTVVSLQGWDDDAVHVETQAARLGRDARLRHSVVTLGGGVVRLTMRVHFDGPGGDADLLGLYFTDAGQHQEHRPLIVHSADNCRSRVTYKGALQGEDAVAVWVGDVIIPEGSAGTDTYELNRNLLLTDGAIAHSIPNLEIETGDVAQAGHASASGRFDDLQLFYLMARGIPADIARKLVVRGFFAEVINRIGVPEIADRLTAAVDDELAQVGI
jgi:Fe-S cluster assembly protein SufD